jgi:Ctr copper transporter family
MDMNRMRSQLVPLLLLVVTLVSSGSLLVEGSGTKEQEMEDFHVPVFTVAELGAGPSLEDLAEVLATTGFISVVGTENDVPVFSNTRQKALSGLCECMQGNVKGADTSLLSDGITRTTLATATVGNTPLSLDKDELVEAGCSSHTVQAMDTLRDHVAWVSHSFVSALDRILLAGDSQRETLLVTTRGSSFVTVASIVKASQNLEHFHLYEKAKGASTKPILDVHTDAGLFLAFVPGMQCDPQENDSKDFYVQHNGVLKRAIFQEGTVGVMLGMGAENWLRTSTPLRATRHAVSMQNGHSRAWYGMSKSVRFYTIDDFLCAWSRSHQLFRFTVHMVPQDAIILDFPKRTFADMRKAMVLAGKRAREFGDNEGEDVDLGDVSIGCGTSPAVAKAASSGATRINRRRLQMVDDASACNNATNFFCWMSCLDIPEAGNAAGYITEGYSLYCLDPATLASTGNRVSAAQEKCNQGSLIGGAHNDACMGSWQPTAPGVPSQEVLVDDESVTAASEPFCYGGTSMYMDGFHWTDPTCVIYLFPSWVLTTAGSLAGACVGTIFFGMALEAVIWKRRSTVQSFPGGWKRVGVSTVSYGLQLTLGYMLMLVIMTYSGPLFMCVILGLMSGHAIFNTGSTKAKTKCTVVTGCVEQPLDSCRIENDVGGSPNSESSNGNGPNVPEGITPCCQNTL